MLEIVMYFVLSQGYGKNANKCPSIAKYSFHVGNRIAESNDGDARLCDLNTIEHVVVVD